MVPIKSAEEEGAETRAAVWPRPSTLGLTSMEVSLPGRTRTDYQIQLPWVSLHSGCTQCGRHQVLMQSNLSPGKLPLLKSSDPQSV